MKRKREIKNHKESFKEYTRLIKPYKKALIFIFITIILLEIAKLIPKYLIGYVIDQGVLYANKEITRELFINELWILLIVLFITTILRAIFVYTRESKGVSLFLNMELDLKQDYFRHLISLDSDFHNSNKTGSIISRLSRGGGAIQGMTETIVFMIFPVIIQFAILIITISYFSIIPTIALIITSILFISYAIFIQSKQKKDKLRFNDAQDAEKGTMSDYFLNIESIKYFGKDKRIKENYNKITEETKDKGKRYLNWFKYFGSGQNLILGFGTIAILFYPLIQFINGEITIGTISFIYTAYFGFTAALWTFVGGIRGYYRNIADIESLHEYKKIKKDIKDKKNAKSLEIKSGRINFKNVDFTYPNGEKVLEKFNLTIPKGKKVAIIGESGSGKSTIIKLLYRLYDIKKGSITIDNKNIKDVTQESLRSEMAIVSQEPILFDDTIYNNIKFSKKGATDEEVRKAMKFAQLDRVIKKLPQKEHTIVGERGVKLSTGQKQRVSIARALLADKKILILDEATSALDSRTEKEIQDDLEKLMTDRTSIIIAHRLSTIINADTIIVVKDGKIVQKGNHKQLIKQKGEYKKLWKYQEGGFLKDAQ